MLQKEAITRNVRESKTMDLRKGSGMSLAEILMQDDVNQGSLYNSALQKMKKWPSCTMKRKKKKSQELGQKY